MRGFFMRKYFTLLKLKPYC